MTFSWQCYQDNFLFNNFNIRSFGDCFGSVIACIAIGLLIELSRSINLYLRHEIVNARKRASSANQTRFRNKRCYALYALSSFVQLCQIGLGYFLMIIVMNDFAGFLLASVIGLGIGYYLLNGVHPYTRSQTYFVHLDPSMERSTASSDFGAMTNSSDS